VRGYEPLASYPGEREMYQKMQATWAQYRQASDRGVDLVKAGKAGDALDLLGGDSTIALFSSALEAVNDDFKFNVKAGTEGAQAATTAATRAIWSALASPCSSSCSARSSASYSPAKSRPGSAGS